MKYRYVVLALMIIGALFLTGCFPQADAGLDTTIVVNLPVTLEGTGSELFGGPVTLTWDFGDGATAAGDVVTHQFASAGFKTVILTVTDNMGMTASDTVEVEVMDWEVLDGAFLSGYGITMPMVTILPNGRMVIMEGSPADGVSFNIIREKGSESSPGARVFKQIITVTAASYTWGSFISAKDDDTVIVGTSSQIFEVDLDTPSYAEIGSNIPSYEAALSGNSLYVTWSAYGSPTSELDEVDITTGAVTQLMADVAGASGGVCLDDSGNVYAGNGYASGTPAETGEIRKLDLAAAPPWAWYTDGDLVADVLSAGTLIWAGDNTMLVGGADFAGGTDIDFFAAVDTTDGSLIWSTDPDPGALSSYSLDGGWESGWFSATTFDWGTFQGLIHLAPFDALGL